jgi:hypothetical protein
LGGGSIAPADPYGNVISSNGQSDVQICAHGQVPPASAQSAQQYMQPASQANPSVAATAGIIKNATTDVIDKSAIAKWMSALFTGVPFTFRGRWAGTAFS